MAKNKPAAAEDNDVLGDSSPMETEDDVRAELARARQRIKALEEEAQAAIAPDGDGQDLNVRRLTSHQDIERAYRLGLMTSRDVEYFVARQQLPPDLIQKGPDVAMTEAVEKEVALRKMTFHA